MSSFETRLLKIESRADAERELFRIGVDPGGIASMASKMVSHAICIKDLQCRQANILKQEMLSLGGDAAVARGSVSCSIEKTDVILIGTDKQLKRLTAKLVVQPFGLSRLAADLKCILDAGCHTNRIWRTSQRNIPLDRPLIMGILNITPDSFSDGSCYIDSQKAIEKGLEMAADGADIIDIGGESTRPGAAFVSPQEEAERVLPVIKGLAGKLDCPLSIDTWKGYVAEQSIDAGAEIVNDISGFTFDRSMPEVVAKTGAAAVLMHTRGTPDKMQMETGYTDIIAEVSHTLHLSVEIGIAAGIERERLAIDPGIGFGKDAAGNLEILRRLREFSGFDLPLLVGTSRKSFIGATLNRETDQRLFGTAASVAMAIANGATIIRVHDVKAMRDVADMTHAIMTGESRN